MTALRFARCLRRGAHTNTTHRCSTLAVVCAWAALGRAGGKLPASQTAATERSDKAREFAPGVRINWRQRVIEVDATVVLRTGPLELLACSPQTREHESIFVVPARPMHIFQAMRMIGLEYGRPAGYDTNKERWLAPSGGALELRVRYKQEGVQRTVPVDRLLLDIESRRPPKPLNWVFAGSRTLVDGRFAADLDGTVICVVDFESALIAPGSLHSADNELLWLAANTEEIPPVGTRCTLLIRSASKGPVEIVVAVAADGTLRRGEVATSVVDLRESFQRDKDDRNKVTIVLRPGLEVPDQTIDVLIEALARAGIDRRFIEVRRSEAKPAPAIPRRKKTDG